GCRAAREAPRVRGGLRVALAIRRGGGGRGEPGFPPRLELAVMEGEEVGALLALDVDDLDELAGPHLVGEGRRGVDPKIETRLRQRRRELLLLVAARRRATYIDDELGGRRRPVHDASRGRSHDHRHCALRSEAL